MKVTNRALLFAAVSLLAQPGCKGDALTNVLTPEVVSYDAQVGTTLGGLEDPLNLQEDPGAHVPIAPDPGGTRSRYNPERHHGAPPFKPAPPICATVPFGVGGLSNLLRSAAPLSSPSYTLRSISLVPSRPRAASSASYELTNIMLKEAEQCD